MTAPEPTHNPGSRWAAANAAIATILSIGNGVAFADATAYGGYQPDWEEVALLVASIAWALVTIASFAAMRRLRSVPFGPRPWGTIGGMVLAFAIAWTATLLAGGVFYYGAVCCYLGWLIGGIAPAATVAKTVSSLRAHRVSPTFKP